MDDQLSLAARFEDHRPRLRAVAYRMLGSLSEADDALQDAWLRISRADTTSVENMGGWLTTVVARVCLNMLRARRSRHEDPLPTLVPDPIVDREDGVDPEHEALLGDSLGLALFVLLETLGPAERVAFVLHDVFGLAFDEIAPIVGRSPAAARQLASRARRRVRGAPVGDPDMGEQRRVVDAFVAAVRAGDFAGLLAVLDPDVVLRADGGTRWVGATRVLHGAETVARSALTVRRSIEGFDVRPALVNGVAGIVTWDSHGDPFSIMGFAVRDRRIVEIAVLADPDRLGRLDLTAVAAPTHDESGGPPP